MSQTAAHMVLLSRRNEKESTCLEQHRNSSNWRGERAGRKEGRDHLWGAICTPQLLVAASCQVGKQCSRAPQLQITAQAKCALSLQKQPSQKAAKAIGTYSGNQLSKCGFFMLISCKLDITCSLAAGLNHSSRHARTSTAINTFPSEAVSSPPTPGAGLRLLSILQQKLQSKLNNCAW